MCKLTAFLIHLFGGVTLDECVKSDVEHYELGRRNAYDMMKRFADHMNGTPADDWCKSMYNHISEVLSNNTNHESN